VAKPTLLQQIVRDLRRKHRFHTLILYGSHARGDATTASDYDLLAVRKGGSRLARDARKWRGAYIDLFIYPENKLRPSALLHVRGGKVLLQRSRFGERFLARLDRLHARGPKRLPSDERTAIRVWARKMLDRIEVGDVEACFRRVWLLTALLEDYFLLRGRWYEGPKLALQWLRENEPETHRLFEKALKRPTNLTAIKALVDAVVE
jgi:Nucleotidyltransferase domain